MEPLGASVYLHRNCHTSWGVAVLTSGISCRSKTQVPYHFNNKESEWSNLNNYQGLQKEIQGLNHLAVSLSIIL